jgi:exodeoxyribonuclease-1
MTSADARGCDKFHSLDITNKAKMLSKLPKNYYERAVRIIGRLDFSKLPEISQQEFQEYLNNVANLDGEVFFVDHRGKPRVSLPEIYEQMQNLRVNENLTEEQQGLLYELEEYLF